MLAFFAPARKAVLRGAAVVAALALAACEPGPIGGGPTVNTSGPVTVALLVPKSSSTQGDGVLSASLENAARLAIADLQGAQIDLRVYDTAGSATTAAAMAQQAANDGAKIILGPLRAEAANAAGLAVASQGINVLSFSNNTQIAVPFHYHSPTNLSANDGVSPAYGYGTQATVRHGQDKGATHSLGHNGIHSTQILNRY